MKVVDVNLVLDCSCAERIRHTIDCATLHPTACEPYAGRLVVVIATGVLVAIAVASGLTNSTWAADEDDFERLIDQSMSASWPTLIGVRIDDKPGVGTTRRDPVQIRERFMHGMGVREPL